MLTTVITIEPRVQSDVFREMLIACRKQAALVPEWLGIVVDLNNSPTNKLIVDDVGDGKVLYLPGGLIDTTKTDKGLPLTVGAAARNMAAGIIRRGRILFMDADCIPGGRCFQVHNDWGTSAHIVAGSVVRETKDGLLRDPRLTLLAPQYRVEAQIRSEQVDKIGHQYVWGEHVSFPWNYFDWTGGFWEYGNPVNMGTELARRFRDGLRGGSVLCYAAVGILMSKFPKRLPQADRDSQYALYASKPYYRGPRDTIQVCHGSSLPWNNSKEHPTPVIEARDIFPQRPNPDFRWDSPPKIEALKPKKGTISFSSDAAEGVTWSWYTTADSENAAAVVNAPGADVQWAVRVTNALNQAAEIQEAAVMAAQPQPIPARQGIVFHVGGVVMNEPPTLPPPPAAAFNIGGDDDDEEDIDDDEDDDDLDDGDDGEWEDDDDLDDLDGGSTLDDYDDDDDDYDAWIDADDFEDEEDDDY